MRRRLPLLLAPMLTATTWLAASSDAFAQTAPQPLQGVLWSPNVSIDPDALPRVEGTRVPGRLNWNAGIAVQVLERPYAGRDAAGHWMTLVSHQLWTNYIVQMGLHPHLAIGLDIPVMLSQGGDLAPIGQIGPANVGFGDVRLEGRWSTRRQGPPASPGSPANRSADNTFTNEGPGLAVVLSASAPTGDPHALTGAGAWIVHPSVVGDFRLFGLVAAAQIGYRARIDSHWPAQGGTCTGTTAMGMPDVSCLSTTPLRDAFTWSAGVRLPPGLFRGIAGPFVEIVGQFDARRPGDPGTYPLELGGGLQRTFGEISVTLAAAGGLTDAPGNPRARVMAMVQWAPRFVDDDNDGLRDNTGEDQCVGLPEDRDGYQDNDGCPEDNDNDEIPDAEDRCPMQDEDMDGFQDEDGCPDPDNDDDGVLDAQDQCPNVAMGPDPDEAHPGCPRNDDDHDGVPNADDRCANEPAGAHPDPARPGCPAPDADHDGIPDANDACPNAAADEHPRAEQNGCPDLDHDHDGVLDAQDRCPTQPETINGVDDADGCPEAPAPRNAHARVRIVGATEQAIGGVELLEPVRFEANDTLSAASEPLIAQLAIALIATSRNPNRTHLLTVPLTPASVRGPLAVDAARAIRRRDAVITALRAHGAPEWAVRPGEPGPAPARVDRNDRGIVILNVDTVSADASSAPAASGAPSASPAPPSNAAATSAAPSNAPPASAAPSSAPPASAAPSSSPPPSGSHSSAPPARRPAVVPHRGHPGTVPTPGTRR